MTAPPHAIAASSSVAAAAASAVVVFVADDVRNRHHGRHRGRQSDGVARSAHGGRGRRRLVGHRLLLPRPRAAIRLDVGDHHPRAASLARVGHGVLLLVEAPEGAVDHDRAVARRLAA